MLLVIIAEIENTGLAFRINSQIMAAVSFKSLHYYFKFPTTYPTICHLQEDCGYRISP